MNHFELLTAFEAKIAIAEERFERTKAALFGAPLSPQQFARRRTYVRELEIALSQMHEMRRRLTFPLRRSSGRGRLLAAGSLKRTNAG